MTITHEQIFLAGYLHGQKHRMAQSESEVMADHKHFTAQDVELFMSAQKDGIAGDETRLNAIGIFTL